MTRIAVIRIRGIINIRGSINDTLGMMNLLKKNHCVVLQSSPQNMGMIKKVKDFVTYGVIDEETFNELVEKKGEEYAAPEKDSKKIISYQRRFFEHNGKKYQKTFRLDPPSKGYGKKGIKKPFRVGGAAGNRKDKINDLVKRMI